MKDLFGNDIEEPDEYATYMASAKWAAKREADYQAEQAKDVRAEEAWTKVEGTLDGKPQNDGGVVGTILDRVAEQYRLKYPGDEVRVIHHG